VSEASLLLLILDAGALAKGPLLALRHRSRANGILGHLKLRPLQAAGGCLGFVPVLLSLILPPQLGRARLEMRALRRRSVLSLFVGALQALEDLLALPGDWRPVAVAVLGKLVVQANTGGGKARSGGERR
jgi:hypothetical protein